MVLTYGSERFSYLAGLVLGLVDIATGDYAPNEQQLLLLAAHDDPYPRVIVDGYLDAADDSDDLDAADVARAAQ